MRTDARRARLAIALAVCLAAAGIVAAGQGGQAPAGGARSGQPAAAQGGGTAGAFRAVQVTAIPGVVAAGAAWTLAWQGTDNADGIVGMPDGSLLFAQEQPNRVSRLDPQDRVSVFTGGTRGTGALSIDAKGRVFAAQRTCTDPGLRAPCAEPTSIGIVFPEAERRVIADRHPGGQLGRLNDLVVSRRGDVYFTSGGAFRMTPEGVVSVIDATLRTNGVMLSPDERTLYITNGPSVVAFDVQADGGVTNQRPFARLEAGGNGDGLAVDADGRLYVTSMASGVQVFGADGRFLGAIPTPRAVISAAFAGPDKRTLYVVGSGAFGADGAEFATPAGVRNNAKSIYRLPTIAQGYRGRAK